MDTLETNNYDVLKKWWDDKDFAGKSAFELNEKGELLLKKNAAEPKVIAQLNEQNADLIFNTLSDKYKELKDKCREIQDEWLQSGDKLKLVSKVSRLKEYLGQVNAIGDFDVLYGHVHAWEKDINSILAENYNSKLAITQQIEALITGTNFKEISQEIKRLTEEWKKTGFIEKERNDELWSRIEKAKETFFDIKKEKQEAMDKEMLQNLDLKLEIVERAEVLAGSDTWKQTAEEYKELMEKWKNIGRTRPEKNEELWNRFIQAKNHFFERRNAHIESIQKEQEVNYKLKLTLVERAELMMESQDWVNTSQAYADLMDEWKAIGRVPQDKSDELWGRLSKAKDFFFTAKRHSLQALKIKIEDNLNQKRALVARAQALQNSTMWKEVTDEMNELMAAWKQIGAVPREYSDAIWNDFLAARTHFFNRKDESRNARKAEYARKREAWFTQTRSFLKKLEDELEDEQNKLAEFKETLDKSVSGPKAEEIVANLEKLVVQTERKIASKMEKITEVKGQIEEMEKKEESANEK